ncbi:PP2C family protein-serine/threonine phosphatase [Actinophytocola xanthii]|uniref:PP2C family protein-serine/threonine phosphatase n=1 Tax=Actinophytocola xanthii TaxID=1912961 RepID=UPI001E629016|nr:PP2C family protein-serine/threonine phosphatase [Actinophytocola xanthii]
MADVAGVVRAVNEAGRTLLPTAYAGARLDEVVPDWLSAAHLGVGSSDGDPAGWIGGRSVTAHPVRGLDSVAWWLVDDTDVRLAREDLRIERERTAFLSRASSTLLSSLNLQRSMDVTAELAAENLAEAALVIAPSAGPRYPVVTCLRGGRAVSRQLTIDPDSVPGLGEALQGFPPVPSRWIDPASCPSWVVPEGFGEVGSVVVTPLPGHGVPAGALILLRTTAQNAFGTQEEIFARLFAARAGAAMSAARMYAEQASITDTLMRELLPPRLHRVAGVDFAGGYRASATTERVGGDFYDVHPAADDTGESLAVLGDVCGKGLDAAVLTGKIRNTLHALLPLADDHAQMLRLLNRALVASDGSRFATLVLASAAREGENVRLRLTCAGHLPPLVVRADGRVEEAPTRGVLVGVLPEVASTTAHVTLAPGETCLLYTDGITEARGGPFGDVMFGEERLRSALAECAGLPAEAVVERVQMLAAEWVGGGRHDDMAVLAITAPRALGYVG